MDLCEDIDTSEILKKEAEKWGNLFDSIAKERAEARQEFEKYLKFLPAGAEFEIGKKGSHQKFVFRKEK